MIKCFLKYIGDDKSVTESIEIRNGAKVMLGRGPITKIICPRCSRNQVELIANFARKTVRLTQVGPNNSALNDEPIGIGLNVVANDGDVIHLLAKGHRQTENTFSYTVHFEDPTLSSTAAATSNNNNTNSNNSFGPKPVKIPRMFTAHQEPKSPNVTATAFLKTTPASKGVWENIDGNQLLVGVFGSQEEGSSAVAAFDLDGTLITTKSGRVFPRDETDWKFATNNTISKLQAFQRSKSTRFLIISNQAGLTNKPQEIPGFKRKVESIVKELGISCLVFASTGKNKYRKPLPHLWSLFVDKYNNGVEPDRDQSFYCGDAAGRKKDFSKSDRLFALNLELVFKTPEEFFLGQKPGEFTMPTFNPAGFLAESLNNDHVEFTSCQEMIIMVGYPGSGKSMYTKSVLCPRSFIQINRDTLKTQAKCISTAERTLDDGQSVVIDNTNPKKRDRAEYIKLAQKHKVMVRCFKMNVDFAQAMHNNKFRQLTDTTHSSVPDVVFNTFRAQYEEPDISEGFSEITIINFCPVFEDDELKQLYSKYLVEK